MSLIAIAAAGMQNDQQRLDAVSQNLANALTPAYRRAIALSASAPARPAARWSEAMEAAAAAPAISAASVAAPIRLALDLTPGTLRYTGSPLDIAVEGKAFIEIATDSGPAYTRQGSLHVDAAGRLVTAQGEAVAGAAGEIIVNGAAAIDRNGDVREDDPLAGARVAGRIRLVHFENPEALAPLGNGRYAQGRARIAQTEGASAVHSGYLENSNVVPAKEMVHLTEVLRHFETLQRLVQGYDDALDKSIRKLGEF